VRVLDAIGDSRLGLTALAVGLVVLVVLAQIAVKRLPIARHFMKMNDIIGFYLNLIGVLYAVALAFIMVAVWENFDQTQRLTDQEEGALEGITYLAHGLPGNFGTQIQDRTRTYAQTVISDEWPRLAQNRDSMRLDRASKQLGLQILAYDPKDTRGAAIDEQLLQEFSSLESFRDQRRISAHHRIPESLWSLMLFGGFATIALCFMFGVEHTGLHCFKTATVAAFVVMSLVITWDLQAPFTGFAQADPSAFSTFLSTDPFSPEGRSAVPAPSFPAESHK
jgi:hypothetical protein